MQTANPQKQGPSSVDGQQYIVDFQKELVAAIEVTDGDVLLSGVGAQVDGILIPVAYVTGVAVAAIAFVATRAFGGHRPLLNQRPAARAVVGHIHAKVLGGINGILGASPEAEGAALNQVHFRRNKVVVGIKGANRSMV